MTTKKYSKGISLDELSTKEKLAIILSFVIMGTMLGLVIGYSITQNEKDCIEVIELPPLKEPTIKMKIYNSPESKIKDTICFEWSSNKIKEMIDFEKDCNQIEGGEYNYILEDQWVDCHAFKTDSETREKMLALCNQYKFNFYFGELSSGCLGSFK